MSNNQYIYGNLNAPSITGSLFGTASHAITASYWSGSITTSATASYYAETDPIFVAKSGSFATTASNTFTGDQTINGNLTVIGTSSFAYTTASIVQVGSNVITLNTNNPATRFGGITVIDSGSFGNSSTGSLFWDSQNNRWIYANPSGSTYDGGMLISGPRNTSGLGNEIGLTDNFVAVGQGTDHIQSGTIYNSGSITQVTGSLLVSASGTGYDLAVGSDKLYVSASGNIGIGTSAPSSKLQVGEAVGDANLLNRGLILQGGYSTTVTRQQNLMTFGGIGYFNTNPFDDTAAGYDRNWHIGSISDTDYFQQSRFSFINSGSEKLTILQNGNVGIGTTSPTKKLDVIGEIGSSDTISITKGASDTIQAGSSVYLIGGSGSSYTQLQQGVGRFTIWTWNGSVWGEKFTINSTSGNVGIGTTTPEAKLDVAGIGIFGSSSSSGIGVALGDYTDNFSGQYSILSNNNHADYIFGNNLAINTNHQLYVINDHPAIAGSAIVLGGNNSPNGTNTISFYAKAQAAVTYNTIVSASSAEMVIKEGGKVGIGTTNPSTILHLNGTGSTITLTETSYGRTSQLGYADGANLSLDNDSASNTYIGKYNNVFMVPTAGNVGIGKASANAKLDVAGDTFISGSLNNGLNNINTGLYSHAEGLSTTASGDYSHAEGYSTGGTKGNNVIASGYAAHAEGRGTEANATASHAEGRSTVASGSYSHAEGQLSDSRGNYSHAEGYSTLSSGSYSHTEGYETIARGRSAHAEGYFTVADGNYQHVQGQYNISSSAESAFIIGNGTGDLTRSNLVFASGSTFQVTGSHNVTGSVIINNSTITDAWTSYTPVWTAASSNPAIGNGTIEGWYKVIGKTCFVRGNIAMGTTTTFGSGEWYVSMPFTASNADAILLTANLLDNTTAWYNAVVNGARAGFNFKAPLQYQAVGGTANDVNATQPFTWTSTDRFIWNGSYEII